VASIELFEHLPFHNLHPKSTAFTGGVLDINRLTSFDQFLAPVGGMLRLFSSF
jgi:hypothetical protein